MIEPIKNTQIIEENGHPAFVVIPYKDWKALFGELEAYKQTKQPALEVYIPHEVVRYQVKQGLSLIAAWRKYKGFTQKALAARLGISQAAVAQFEKTEVTPHILTLKKIARALGIGVECLQEN